MDNNFTYQEELEAYKRKRSMVTMTVKEFKEVYNINSLRKANKIVNSEGFPKVKVGSQILIIQHLL